jgi:hypothetical protein
LQGWGRRRHRSRPGRRCRSRRGEEDRRGRRRRRGTRSCNRPLRRLPALLLRRGVSRWAQCLAIMLVNRGAWGRASSAGSRVRRNAWRSEEQGIQNATNECCDGKQASHVVSLPPFHSGKDRNAIRKGQHRDYGTVACRSRALRGIGIVTVIRANVSAMKTSIKPS